MTTRTLESRQPANAKELRDWLNSLDTDSLESIYIRGSADLLFSFVEEKLTDNSFVYDIHITRTPAGK